MLHFYLFVFNNDDAILIAMWPTLCQQSTYFCVLFISFYNQRLPIYRANSKLQAIRLGVAVAVGNAVEMMINLLLSYSLYDN